MTNQRWSPRSSAASNRAPLQRKRAAIVCLLAKRCNMRGDCSYLQSERFYSIGWPEIQSFVGPNFLACPAKYPSPNTKNTGKRTAKAVRVIGAGVSKPYRISNPRKPGNEMEAAGASPHFLHFRRHLLWLKDESLEDSAS